MFSDVLKSAGWREEAPDRKYSKDGWALEYDTSRWIAIGTANIPSILDVPVPDKSEEQWTVNLISHVLGNADKMHLLKHQLLKKCLAAYPEAGWNSGLDLVEAGEIDCEPIIAELLDEYHRFPVLQDPSKVRAGLNVKRQGSSFIAHWNSIEGCSADDSQSISTASEDIGEEECRSGHLDIVFFAVHGW